MTPVGAIFPAEKGVLGLYGRILPGGDIEYGYLILDEGGSQRWVSQRDAAVNEENV